MYYIKDTEKIRKELHYATHEASVVIPLLLQLINNSQLILTEEEIEICTHAISVSSECAHLAVMTRVRE